ncbi:hypothetical protein GcM3_02995 [Golovinomyces cichoracearum]|uniref:Uncharacterized protein n=1 Tax=Golovinomyces cichoracearum TaxID=62708 RepID=A0A420IVP3_9PEZI|nr:hypothetical protein GcM3_02995 [Golovinomyces cichoracearum]
MGSDVQHIKQGKARLKLLFFTSLPLSASFSNRATTAIVILGATYRLVANRQLLWTISYSKPVSMNTSLNLKGLKRGLLASIFRTYLRKLLRKGNIANLTLYLHHDFCKDYS